MLFGWPDPEGTFAGPNVPFPPSRPICIKRPGLVDPFAWSERPLCFAPSDLDLSASAFPRVSLSPRTSPLDFLHWISFWFRTSLAPRAVRANPAPFSLVGRLILFGWPDRDERFGRSEHS